MGLTTREKVMTSEAIDDIAYQARELVGKCKDLATFLLSDDSKHTNEIRRVSRFTALLAEAIEIAYGNLPRIDEN